MDNNTDIIKYKPGWLIRNGTMLLLLAIVLFAIVSFFIPYPRVINLQARVRPEVNSGTFSLIVQGNQLSTVKPQSSLTIESKPNQISSESRTSYRIRSVSLLDAPVDSSIINTNWTIIGKETSSLMEERIVNIQIINYDQRLSDMLWRQMKTIFTLN